MLVVGSGPAGLAAASAAAARGQQVILCDEQAEAGGSLLVRGHRRFSHRWPGPGRGSLKIAEATAGIHRAGDPHHRVRLVSGQHDRTAAAGHGSSARAQARNSRVSGCGWFVPKRVVIATGAIERPNGGVSRQRPARRHARRRGGHVLYRYGVSRRTGRRRHLARQRLSRRARAGGGSAKNSPHRGTAQRTWIPGPGGAGAPASTRRAQARRHGGRKRVRRLARGKAGAEWTAASGADVRWMDAHRPSVSQSRGKLA